MVREDRLDSESYGPPLHGAAASTAERVSSREKLIKKIVEILMQPEVRGLAIWWLLLPLAAASTAERVSSREKLIQKIVELMRSEV